MRKLFKLGKDNISEILLVVGSIGIILAFCLEFEVMSAQLVRILWAMMALISEGTLMYVLSYYSKKPGESGVFMLIYLLALIILTAVIMIYSFRYLANPIAVSIFMGLFAVFVLIITNLWLVALRVTRMMNNK